MPITSSAKKAMRAARHKRVFNLRRKSAVESELKRFRKAIAGNDRKGAEKLMPGLFRTLDKSAKTGYLKPNAAARLKSRAAAALKKIS
ncbi:MAG: 30S ribosomal protein S20 [Minisyncoccia bacterium]|jgi:ribosomal protein S20